MPTTMLENRKATAKLKCVAEYEEKYAPLQKEREQNV
jgi:hypothetical protein